MPAAASTSGGSRPRIGRRCDRVASPSRSRRRHRPWRLRRRCRHGQGGRRRAVVQGSRAQEDGERQILLRGQKIFGNDPIPTVSISAGRHCRRSADPIIRSLPGETYSKRQARLSPKPTTTHRTGSQESYASRFTAAFLRVRHFALQASASARVYHVTDYGADPTGATDATAAINKAIADAFRPPTNATMTGGIPDLGGAEVHLDGGTYLIKGPLSLPASGGGNFKIHSGSLRASDDFPTDRYLIELSASKSGGGRSYDYEYATLRDLMLDCSYRGGGVTVVDSLRVAIDNCYVAHFASDGIAVRGGHETFIRNTFLGQHMTAGGDPGERGFTGTGIHLDGNDNSVSDVVIFSAATGIMVTAPANSISGVHCYNKATGFGGMGIYLKIPGLTQAWISNCYMDYTSIVAEDPVLLHVSGSFFLGDANVVLKAVNGVARGIQVVGNIFSGRDKGVDIVQLDGKFTTVDQVYVQQNSATGMTIKSTSARASAEGNGSSWTLDFSPVLLFPDRIGHVQYSLVAGDEFPGQTLRNVSGNQVVVATDKAVSATVHVLVDQNSD
ncbi:polygalacturonase QRT3-like isoform X1 [Miscanthus floridulus]|uniref:polygalacturonase QRT3-like isoform X1 n=1 Tax=Miscanthus floridulus TaxID=154761 RepID=UPI003458FF8D